jgi:Mg/Co/Ni transporter MgtE
MLLEQLDKYIKEADIVDTVNKVGRMNTNKLVEYLLDCNENDKIRILHSLDGPRRREVETLMEGGIL